MFVYLIALLLVLAIFYLRRRQRFWKDRGFPSTSPNLLFGDIGDVALLRKRIAVVCEDIYKRYPSERCVGFYEFFKPNLLIRDPQLIESVLIKDFSTFIDRVSSDNSANNRLSKHLFLMRGKQWKDLRSKLITTFSTNKLKLMMPLMERCAQIMDSHIAEKCEEESVDIKEVVSRFTTDVIGCCVFGLQFNTLTEPESEYRKIGKEIFSPSIKSFIISFLRILSPKVVTLLKLRERSPEQDNFFDSLLHQSEEFRKKESFRRNDLMQSILDLRDHDQKRALNKEVSNEEMIDDDVVLSTVFLFYIAGFETTASTLSFCFYELALHPEYQQRLREEIRTVLEKNDNVVSYEMLKKLTYAEMVISEALRKYPPAGLLVRVCTMPYQLPDSSLHLAPGNKITIPVTALHYDEKYYPDPHTFDPERFTPENIAARTPFTYLPFGGGPRICIAVRFAMMEMKLCLVRILSQYEFSPCSKTDIPLKMHPLSLLPAPKNGIYLRVRRLTQDEN